MIFKKCKFSVIALFTIILSAVFLFFACGNLFDDITTNYLPLSEPDEERTITLSGSVVNRYLQNNIQSRSAQPEYEWSDTNYIITATAPGVSGTRNGTPSATGDTFSIPLTLGKVWTINVQMQKKENDDTDYVTVFTGTYTFDHALTESDLSTSIVIVLYPSMSADKTGKIELSLGTEDAELYDSVTIEPLDSAQQTIWNAAITTNTNGTTGTRTISASSIKSGIYTVTISFKLSGVVVYYTTQDIYVYDYMTTRNWQDNSGNDPAISGGSFLLTQSAINNFKITNYFVVSSTNTPAGNNNNTGSPASPIASISEALRRISVTGGGEAYKIWLMSDITENVSMWDTSSGGSIALNGKASSITIKSTQSGGTTLSVASGRVLRVDTTVPVTLEKLTITGGSAGEHGGGIYIASNAEVTLASCTVTGNSVTGSSSQGGGIYNDGTLKVKGKVTVTDNTNGSGANIHTDNVYLPTGKTITVSGTLDGDSRIGVTTATKPGYGTPLVFTTGFNASGLEPSDMGTVFTSDEGYAVVAGSGTNAGEAVLEASGGNIGDAFDYDVTLSCEATEIAAGSAITVAAAVSRNGTAVTAAAGDITWNFELLCYGDSVATIPSYAITPAAGSARVAIPPSVSLFEGVHYTLHASAIYNGIAYDNDFTLTGSRLGFVSLSGATVSGAVGSGDTASPVFIAGRTVTIPNMYVSKYEITQAEYQTVMGVNPSNPVSVESQVNQENWFDALVYCNKKSMTDGLMPCYAVNGKTDPSEWGYEPHVQDADLWISGVITCNFDADGYRLPTEAEWEYIARSDNGLGICNMLNGHEWCWDSYSNTITSSTPATGAAYTSANNHSRHMTVRGGDGTIIYRRSFTPEYQSIYISFRVVCTAPGTPLASGTSGTAGTTATYMYFGEWPQTIKASGVTVDETVSKEMGMFTYYYGSDGAWYAKQAENGYASAADSTYSNGTTVAQGGTSYKYFKVEPIKWRVLTTNFNGTGKKLLLAENILTNGVFYPYNENRTIDGVTVYQHNWKYSRIRAYLNGTSYNLSGTQNNEFVGKGFLQTAFTSSLQSKIVTSLLDNSAASADPSTPGDYLCGNTYDNVFFLSAVESGSYGLDNASRIRTMTDFAKATGACGDWWLRTPHKGSNSNPCLIYTNGTYTAYNAIYSYHGIVPAICFDD